VDEVWRNSPTQNLGQVLFGDRIRPSVYQVFLRVIRVVIVVFIIAALSKPLLSVFQLTVSLSFSELLLAA